MLDNIFINQLQEAPVATNDKYMVAMIAAIASLLVALFTLIFTRINHRELLAEKRVEEKRKEIYKKLNEFYGPFQQYLNTSKELFKILKQGKPKEFRTLLFLLDKEMLFKDENNVPTKVVLSKADEELLKQILSIGEKLETLIVEKAGLVDDQILRFDYTINSQSNTDVTLEKNGLLAIAKAHFQIIRLAHSGAINGELDKFKDYVFPRDLPGVIEDRIQALQAELNTLNSK